MSLYDKYDIVDNIMPKLSNNRAGSLNRVAGADATADSTGSKKTWISKSFSRITQKKKKFLQTKMNCFQQN